MKNTFFWHDYETFGDTPRSDRPAQFAGVRTDMDLNEIGEPVMLYCKPSKDALLPAPQACLITGITPSYCEQHGVSECEFAAVIERELATPGTIGVGYNSIRFDDEVTRFLFWRNLIDPYAREWQNDCSRWDILDLVRGIYAFFPESLQWTRHADGKVSFKLSDLSAANGLLHENAHDALSDVRATIGLARLIKNSQEKFFNFCLRLRSKHFVQEQLSLHAKAPLVHISGMYGVERGCLALVWPLADHPTNKNEVIVWDLANDPSILTDLTAEDIKMRLFTRQEELPDNIARLPIKTIAINKSPLVAKLSALTAQRAERLGIDLDIIHKHAEIAKQLHFAPTLWRDVYQQTFDRADVDEDLYGGFLSSQDRAILNKLRNVAGDALGLEKPRFADARLNELFFRYRARNFPSSLSADEKTRWNLFCEHKFANRLEKFWHEFDLVATKATEKEKAILEDVKLWIGRHSTLEKAPLA